MGLFTDTFTNTAGTGLVAHGWSVSGADALNIANGGVSLSSNGGSGATWTVWSPPTQPSGADHYVQAVCVLGAVTWLPLGVRVNPTNKTGYFARRTGTAIQLYRGNAGTLTLLGSFTGGSSSGLIKLVATGTTLQVFNDGVSVIGPLTDVTYSDVGVGILTRGGTAQTASALDNWESSESAGGLQTLSPALFANDNTFYGATLSVGAVTLAPALFTNSSTFHAPTVSLSGGPQTLTAGLFTNSATFHAPTVTLGAVTLSPSLLSNSSTFYSATVSNGAGAQTLTVSLFANDNDFPAATVTVGAVQLTAALFANSNVIYLPVISDGDHDQYPLAGVSETYPLAGVSETYPLAGIIRTYPLQVAA